MNQYKISFKHGPKVTHLYGDKALIQYLNATYKLLIASGDDDKLLGFLRFLLVSSTLINVPESGNADSSGKKKKVVLGFHCKYSAMRATTVDKYICEQDQHMNMSHYPALHYPEVYILEGCFARYFAHSP